MADHIGYDGFDNKVFREVVVVDAAAGAALEQQRQSPDTAFPPPPSAVASSVTSLYIDPCYRNLNNVVHGGAFSLIFDLLTTIALGAVEEPDHWAYVLPSFLFFPLCLISRVCERERREREKKTN